MRLNFFIILFRFLGKLIPNRLRTKNECSSITPKIDVIQMEELNPTSPKSPISLTPSEELLYI